MARYLCLMLPFPPSVNGLFAGKARRYLSPGYKAWKIEAGYAINQQEIKHFGGPVQVEYAFGRPDKRTRDVFNYEKAISDILVEHNILRDDSLIERGTIGWEPDIVGCRVEIWEKRDGTTDKDRVYEDGTGNSQEDVEKSGG